MHVVVLHLTGEDPVMGEMDNMPGAADTFVLVKNPRRRDGKDLHYLEANVTHVYWPITRIHFIEVIPTGEEEEIISFVRE